MPLHDISDTRIDTTGFTPEQRVFLDWQLRWRSTARANQFVPRTNWTELGVLAGRGFGKTRVGAEWITRAVFEDETGFDSCVIAPTYQDVKFTCFEGESGILNVLPPALLADYNKSDLVVKMYNAKGDICTIRGFTAEKPERLRGPQHTRAWCFVAGTHVATPTGSVPIEALRAGDVVLTRKGPRAVLANSVRAAKPVGSVSFDTGAKLVGTGDHPVYTSHGWTRLDRLRVGDTVCAINVSSGAASAGTATPTITSEPINLLRLSARFGCTALSGSTITAPSLMAGTYTTTTRTRATTASTIFGACRQALIRIRTAFSSVTAARGVSQSLSPPNAALVAHPLFGGYAARSTAVRAASKSERMLNAKQPSSARTVAARSRHAPVTFAASVASTWQPAGAQSVYCLKVEGEPEYFANGILVHNCDELAAWQYDEDTWDMMMMGMRLGERPQVLWTTTPKPKELIRTLTAPKASRIIVRGSTYDNKANLPETFFDNLAQYEGTTLGRQELYGELIDPEESGIIQRSWINLWPADKPLPQLDFIIMSLDTAYTEKSLDRKGDPDPTACGVWGLFTYKEMTHIILLDCWEDHLGLPDLMKRVKKELEVRYGDDEDTALIRPMFGSGKPLTSGRKPDLLLIEDKGSGISLRQMLDREGIRAFAYNPGKADKLSRLHMASPIFAQRRVWMPESDKKPGRPRSWCEPVIHQLCSFTGERSIKHDDHVDQTTQAVRVLMDKGLLKLTKTPKRVEGDRPAPKVYRNPYSQ